MKLSLSLLDLELLQEALTPVDRDPLRLFYNDESDEEREAWASAANELSTRIRATTRDAKRVALGESTKPASFANVAELEIASRVLLHYSLAFLDNVWKRRRPKGSPRIEGTRAIDRMDPDERERYEALETLRARIKDCLDRLKRMVSVKFEVAPETLSRGGTP
jgi:hypothetical protein